MQARLLGRELSLCTRSVNDHSSRNLPCSPLCPGTLYSLFHSPQQGASQDNHPCTRRPPPATHSDMSPIPAQAALDGPWHHQPCWDAHLSSHGSSFPQGSEMPLLHFRDPCAGSVSPSTTLLLPHATVQWNTGMSKAFSIHILCFTTAPALFPCHKPCSIIHIPSSPHSPSSRLSRYSLSQQFAECHGGRLCGNDSYRQNAGTWKGALPCSSLCKGLWESLECLKYNLPSPKGAEKGSHKVQTIF